MTKAIVDTDSLETYLWHAFDIVGLHKCSISDHAEFVLGLIVLKAASDRANEATAPTGARVGSLPLLRGADRWANPAPLDVPHGARWSPLRFDAERHPEGLAHAIGKAAGLLEDANPSLNDALFGLRIEARVGQRPNMVEALFLHIDVVDLAPSALPEPWSLGEAFDRLLLRLAHEERAAGSYRTLPGVEDILTAAMRAEPHDHVHDPAAGTCRLLLSTARAMARDGEDPTSLRLSGCEISRRSQAFGRMNLWCSGLDGSDIRLVDALSKGVLGASGSPAKAERIICEPPFGRWRPRRAVRTWTSLWPGPPPTRLDAAFLRLCKARLRVGGRGAVLVPTDLLSRGGELETFRRAFLEEGVVEAVLALPPGLVLGSATPSAVVVLDTDANRNNLDQVLFIDCERLSWTTGPFMALESRDVKIVETYLSRKSVDHHSARLVPIQQLLDAGSRLDAAEHFESPGQLRGRELADLRTVSSSTAVAQLGDRRAQHGLVLRDEQQAGLERLTTIAEDSGLATLAGPFGIGKTTVAKELIARLSDRADFDVHCLDMTGDSKAVAHLESVSSAMRRNPSQKVAFILDEWGMFAGNATRDGATRFQLWLNEVRNAPNPVFVLLISSCPAAEIQDALPNPLLSPSALSIMETVALQGASTWGSMSAAAAGAGVGAGVGAAFGLAVAGPVGTLLGGIIGAKVGSMLQAVREPSFASDISDDGDTGIQSSSHDLTDSAVRLLSRLTPRDQPDSTDLIKSLRRSDSLFNKTIGEFDAVMKEALFDQESDSPSLTAKAELALVEILKGAANETVNEDTAFEVLKRVAANLMWERFLEEVARDHAWLAREMKAAGFDGSNEGSNLSVYLQRTAQRPEEFAADLVRPTDLEEMFPDVEPQASMASTWSAAYDSWLERRVGE